MRRTVGRTRSEGAARAFGASRGLSAWRAVRVGAAGRIAALDAIGGGLVVFALSAFGAVALSACENRGAQSADDRRGDADAAGRRDFSADPAAIGSDATRDADASALGIDGRSFGSGADAGDASVAAAYAFDDGDDDPDDPADQPSAPLPAHFALTKVGTPPLALTRVCDLTSFKGALYAAHANQPLGTDGATITRYQKDTGKFAVAFDWNRPGEPTKGGGAGQGFLRVHKFGGRLFVSDADPPYNGLGLVEYGTEGYVFVSDHDGNFARARMPGFKPPAVPDANGKAGASILPRAYHVIDVARFEGSFFASTGSVPPTERAWHGASPGALHRARADLSRFVYDVDYPFPYKDGVWRLTFMTRFRGRLYAGIQDYDGREPNDYVYIAPSDPATLGAPASDASAADGGLATLAKNRTRMTAVRATDFGAAETLRWRVDPQTHTLYWIEWSRDGVYLRSTKDGDTWSIVDLPAWAGRPTDIRRFGADLIVLTERALLSLEPDGTTRELLRITDKKTPFELGDFFCAAPLGIYQGQLYAGGQRGGAIYRFDPRADSDGGAN